MTTPTPAREPHPQRDPRNTFLKVSVWELQELMSDEELPSIKATILQKIDERSHSTSPPAPAPDATVCLECTYPEGGICAKEDFCKGCDNFDAFFNSCKLVSYKTSIGGKKETIHPHTNPCRWLLAIVGCASDTRSRPHPAPTDEQCRICSQAIERKARERVLDELFEWIEKEKRGCDNPDMCLFTTKEMQEKVESLRGAQEEQGGVSE